MLPIQPIKPNEIVNKTDQNNGNSRNQKTIITSNNSEDLINLLDGVHITKQSNENDKERQIAAFQIRMLEDFLKTSKLNKEQTERQEAEFKSFFDKYEYNNTETSTHKLESEELHLFKQDAKKNREMYDNEYKLTPDMSSTFGLEDSPKLKQKSQEILLNNGYKTISDASFVYDIHETPKVLVPKLEEPVPKFDDKELKINEDLIEEVMFEQYLEKQRIKVERDVYKETTQNLPKETGLRKQGNEAPQTSKSSTCHRNSNIFDEILAKNQVKLTKTNGNSPEFITDTIKTSLPTNMLGINTTKSDQKAFATELATKYDIKYLETIKKVEKTFRKQNELKSEADKAKLTPGPSLFEKAVILPQIMQRINERQRKIEEKSLMKYKLVLGPGQLNPTSFNTQKSHENSLSHELPADFKNLELPDSEVLMADCKKVRLIAYETRKLHSNFVRTGNLF